MEGRLVFQKVGFRNGPGHITCCKVAKLVKVWFNVESSKGKDKTKMRLDPGFCRLMPLRIVNMQYSIPDESCLIFCRQSATSTSSAFITYPSSAGHCKCFVPNGSLNYMRGLFLPEAGSNSCFFSFFKFLFYRINVF